MSDSGDSSGGSDTDPSDQTTSSAASTSSNPPAPSSLSSSTSLSSSPPSGTPLALLSPDAYLNSPEYVAPTDIYWPRYPEQGPTFLDTGGCLCALQAPPNDLNLAWQCLGNHTQNPYALDTGKWFQTLTPATNQQLPMWDASAPPDTSNVFVASPGGTDDDVLVNLATVSPNPLSVYDQACTAKNETIFSTAWYKTYDELATNSTPTDGAPCWRVGAIPLPITNVTTWLSTGCQLGFYCPNNTVNSLPQYCNPLEPCLEARLSGATCMFPFQGPDQKSIPMGPFEPVLCTPGYYCPPGGQLQINCPAGTFCQPGSTQPTPCAPGSSCSQNSEVEYVLLPFGLLIALDVILIVATLFCKFYYGFTSQRMANQSSLKRSVIGTIRERKGYKTLDDETEMTVLESHIQPLHRAPTGLNAAMDQHFMQRDSRPKDSDLDGFSTELRQFVDSMRKAIQGSNFGLSFEFSQLSFSPKQKPVLSEITGSIASGSLVGVMGGSGAGKSTFVNVLMGRVSHTGGMVKINGAEGKMKQYKKIIGYVPQDDIVLPELTVRENILHSARIRLPANWPQHDIETHVDSVVDCLELAHVRDSLVGSIAKPVISGGQRKRVSIGMELAAAPMAIFLDEPTSGLDATSASSIMKTLKALSKLGITVIVIIHQPRIEIFEMIDDLILLGNGKIIYQGAESAVQSYFEQLGYHFPEHSNAGDVVTDIITGAGRAYKTAGDVSKESLISHWHNITADQGLKQRPNSTLQESAALRNSIKKRGAPWWRQTWFNLTRSMLQQYRTKASFWFEMGVASLGGFLIGLAQNGHHGVNFVGLFNSDYEILSSAVDYKSVPQMALLVAISIGLIASAPGVRVFGEERLLYRRESSSGHNRLSYYIAKIVSTGPRMLLGCLHFTTLFILLATPLIPWGTSFLSNLLYFYNIYGLASIVSMVTRREDGPLLAVMASLIVGVLSGAAPTLAKVTSWHVAWLWRMSPGCWLAEIYISENVLPLSYLYQVDKMAKATGFNMGVVGLDLGLLLCIGTIYRFLAFGGLVWSGRAV